ncbi:MAG: M15 family metallopeptidase [Clostridiales bacterium]|nr:M15 family metallopeptidase [Clostridiales bacterium]
MSSLTKVLSLLAAASMTVSGAMNAAAPQHDPEGLLFLVNRQNMVSVAYEPDDLEMSDVPGQVRRMRPAAAAALREMFQACREETGCQLLSISGYRSYAKQEGIYRRKLRSVKGSTEKAQEYVAPPGASEHQTGLAMDIGQKNKIHLEVSFRDTVGGKWCRENCWRFGFIMRYNEGWEEITGYSYEPWHFRYVGREFAKMIHEANVPMETWLVNYRAEKLREIISYTPAPATPTDLE